MPTPTSNALKWHRLCFSLINAVLMLAAPVIYNMNDGYRGRIILPIGIVACGVGSLIVFLAGYLSKKSISTKSVVIVLIYGIAWIIFFQSFFGSRSVSESVGIPIILIAYIINLILSSTVRSKYPKPFNDSGAGLSSQFISPLLKVKFNGYAVLSTICIIGFAWLIFEMRNYEASGIYTVVIGAILTTVTTIGYMTRKSRAILISVINLAYLNIMALYLILFSGAYAPPLYVKDMVINQTVLISEGGFFRAFSLSEDWFRCYVLFGLIILSLITLIIYSIHQSRASEEKTKVLWMELNETPSKRDNSLFKIGCAVASVVMFVSLFMPFFSVNIFDFSQKHSFISMVSIGHNLRSDFLYDGINTSLFLILLYIFVLFFISFIESKSAKVSIALATGISIACLVFSIRPYILGAISGSVGGIDSFGIFGYITEAVGSVFTSLFKFEFGIWMLFISLAAYILFAACQFSRIKKPTINVPTISTAQIADALKSATTQVIKVRCSECAALNDDNAAFCNSCGNPIKKIAPNVCAQCGMKIPEDAKFCSKCGAQKE